MSVLPDIKDIWSISKHKFNDFALEIFQFQVKNNTVYAQYVDLIDKKPSEIDHYTKIPFLPISFFKTHRVVTGDFIPQKIFESSSTTGIHTSKNHIKDISLYHKNCLNIIEQKLGDITNYEILGLLPNYLERQNSSLVSMVRHLMGLANQKDAFYLYEYEALSQRIKNHQLKHPKKKILLFGVSFALLDFAEEYTIDSEITIIETGGMKGRKKEITKAEVYTQLQDAFPKAAIISEYGMTELLSQAYSDKEAKYSCPAWMRVLPRADNDPFSTSVNGHTAALNIIDLANLHSCCFIATDDLGKVFSNGTFEVTGRMDHSDVRGCSLMI